MLYQQQSAVAWTSAPPCPCYSHSGASAVSELDPGLHCDRPQTAPCRPRPLPHLGRPPLLLPPQGPVTPPRPRERARPSTCDQTAWSSASGPVPTSGCRFWRVWSGCSMQPTPRNQRLPRPCSRFWLERCSWKHDNKD